MRERTVKRMKQARLQSVRRILPTRIRTQVLKKLCLFAIDVDGVLTDGGMYYGESDEEMKKFNARMGRKNGLAISLMPVDKWLIGIQGRFEVQPDVREWKLQNEAQGRVGCLKRELIPIHPETEREYRQWC